MPTPRAISFYDLKKCVPGAIGIMERNNEEEILNLLEQLVYRDWETDRKSTRLNSSH